MQPEPITLAIDTSAAHCAVALSGRETKYLAKYEEMQRGQAERLMPLCEETLAEAGMQWKDLQLIGVGVGPGNFTGIRISVSAARGLSLGLGIPAMGVTGFEQMHQGVMNSGRVIISLPAPRQNAYVQTFRAQKPLNAPSMIDLNDPPTDLRETLNPFVLGYKAGQIAAHFGALFQEEKYGKGHPEMTAANIALIAQNKFFVADGPIPRPAPLYVRSADAAPPREPAPVILA